ncbi:MAG: spermine/spermidine synthase domain-containing protein, partial [Methylococcaceae bacterium]
SLALLGYGVSGVFLALNRDRLSRSFPEAVMTNLLLFSFSAPACFLLAQQIPFNPAEILWTPVQFLYLCSIYLILTPPFFFAANVAGLSLYRFKEQVSTIYAADLFGAGVGSVGVILLLFVMFPEQILTVLVLSGILATLIVLAYAFRQQSLDTSSWIVACIIGIAVTIGATGWIKLAISPYKSESQLLLIPGTQVTARYSSPLGLLSVVNTAITPLRYAPGLSLNATAEPPEQLAVFTDADNMTAITRYNGDPETVNYLDQTTSALPYHLKQYADILILGAGTGSDILRANSHAIKHIDAVELNPQVIDLVKNKYADFAGRIYSGANVKLHVGEARGFVATSNKTYDLINISLLDAFGASAGLYSMAENYLYTEQAIQDYMQHVSADGYLSITRWIKMPPRDEPKLLATVINALKQKNIAQPGQQLIMIRSWQTSTLLVKNSVISSDEINRLKQFCNERSFDLVYYPGISAQEVNRFNIQSQPYLYEAATALLGNQSEAFIEDYKFNIEPATDDKPYFFHFFKWQTLLEIISLLDSGGIFLLESGYLLLIAALLQAIIASLVLIALPLRLWKSKLGITNLSGTALHLPVSRQAGKPDVKPETGSHLRILVYFFCLGLAFLFIEIAFIQKFILILHHPLYAITVVLSTFLLTAGTGSYFSEKLSRNPIKSVIMLPIATITLFSMVYILSFDSITRFLLETGYLSRYVVSILLIAPLGFCMGMPFPMALARLSQTTPALIPWAWGINGCASVISAILATLIAMQFGFTVLIFLAIALYCLAAMCFPKLTTECR